MSLPRREFLTRCAATAGIAGLATTGAAAITEPAAAASRRRANPIAVSTYSYWRYRKDTKLSIAPSTPAPSSAMELAINAPVFSIQMAHCCGLPDSNYVVICMNLSSSTCSIRRFFNDSAAINSLW